MQSIPGGGDVRSEQPVLVIGENKVTESTPRPRLQAINRQQMILRAMDVEQLIPEDHEARAIWEFVGGAAGKAANLGG